MRATAAYAELLQLNRPVIRTSEAAARLRLPKYAASRILKQLANDGVLPQRFSRAEIRRWVRRIPAKRLRTLVTRRLEEVLTQASQS